MFRRRRRAPLDQNSKQRAPGPSGPWRNGGCFGCPGSNLYAGSLAARKPPTSPPIASKGAYATGFVHGGSASRWETSPVSMIGTYRNGECIQQEDAGFAGGGFSSSGPGISTAYAAVQINRATSHFLGVGGASRFVALLSGQPDKSAPEAFPRAAKANRSLFYAKADKTEAASKASGKPEALSVAEVQERIGAMIDKRVARYASVRTNFASAQTVSQ